MAEERVQRRLAAIMAADVVGYSRLMGEDETGTLKALKELRSTLVDPAIREHRGRMVKVMGDGALVEFGSVVDAVECAGHIQRAMADKNTGVSTEKQIEFRIGINLGDIIIEGRDIYGDGVNVAARLEGLAEPGGICISGTVFEHVKGKLDLSFEDLGQQQVKNIAEPVRVYRARIEPDTGTKAETSASDTKPQLSVQPSIAVLPFDNLSNDPEQEYFSDGLAEDLITDLSKISSLSVAARNSSFTYKGRAVKVQDVSRELGVTHVLEGSVRKMGDRLRINAQLIAGTDGRHRWAERYDGNMSEIFEFQDAIREQIVSALQVSLTPTDRARTERKPTDSVEAYDLFLKGRASIYLHAPEHFIEARRRLEEAIEIDPNFADAYGYLSLCHFYAWVYLVPGFDDGLDRAHDLAEKGVSLDDTSATALTRLGWVQAFLRHYDAAIANFERAIILDPNNAEVYAAFAQVLNYWGNPERALEMLKKAFSIEMLAPPIWEYYEGLSRLLLRQYDQALAIYNRVAERAPKMTPAYLQLAYLYVELDRLDDAKNAIKIALDVTPQLTAEHVARWMPYRIDEVRERIFDGYRQAGLPEG
jgi:adenylate cyclase